MRERAPGIKILMVLLMLGVVTYFGMQAARYYNDPMTTAIAYSYLVEESADLNGYVMRSEQVLPDDAAGLLRLERREGERVSAGGVVATVYTDEASLTRQKELETLSERIEQLESVESSMLSVEAAEKLDREIAGAIVDYRSSLAADRLDIAEESGRTLRTLIMKRDYTYYAGVEDLTGELEALRDRQTALQRRSEGSVRSITSPASGLYSAVVDGYETVLTPETVESLTPTQLSQLRPEESVRSRTGKLILGDAWYYVAAVKESDLSALAEAGNRAILRFGKGVDRDLEVEVSFLGAAEDGVRLAVLRGREYLPQLTLLRGQSAKLVWNTIEGIRVPNAALRVSERTVTDDETGAERTERTVGVYCVVGAKAQFKSAEVLYSGKDFSILLPTAASETARLRSGDQVIVRARDLFDGKVVG